MSYFASYSDAGRNMRLDELERKARLQESVSRAGSNIRRRAKAAREELEDQVGELKLLCRALIATLKETELLDAEKFEAHLKRIDAEDGTIDGKVTPPVKPPKVFKKRGRRWSR